MRASFVYARERTRDRKARVGALKMYIPIAFSFYTTNAVKYVSACRRQSNQLELSLQEAVEAVVATRPPVPL